MKRSREPDQALPGSNDAAASPASGGEEPGSPAPKIAELDHDADADDDTSIGMRCALPPHKELLIFRSYEDYEVHYQKVHTNRCLECGKNFPSPRFLELHIEEIHDSFVAIRRDRGERTVGLSRLAKRSVYCSRKTFETMLTMPVQYSCFVEGCETKYLTPKTRRLHLVDKHMYPKNFFFTVTRDGIDGRQSLLFEGRRQRRRPSISSNVSANETRSNSRARKKGTEGLSVPKKAGSARESVSGEDEDDGPPAQAPDVEMEDLTGAISALRFVPSSVRFGRGGRKAGFSKR